MAQAPISVAVLVDLDRTAVSGGHVKSWERLAEAADAVRAQLDLTVYVLGARRHVDEITANARFVALRPVLGTRTLQTFAAGTDATDLAPYHPALARLLPRHDVWHATHAFAFGWTARRLALRTGHPLVASLQTDLPAFVRLYLRALVDRVAGRRIGGRLLVDTWHVDDRAGRFAARHQRRLLEACGHVLVSNDVDAAEAARVVGPDRVSLLRRGVDRSTFHPRRHDRAWLTARYGVPASDVVVLFAGRADATKGALKVARAVRLLREAGHPVHMFVAGAGGDLGRIGKMLGEHATLPGALPQDELAGIYAACDVFAFPSTSETIGNVVAEAMAAGLPVVLHAGATTNQWLRAPGRDGVLVGADDPSAWAAALEPLVDSAELRARIGQAARRSIEQEQPSWEQVLAEDLMPVWERAAVRPAVRAAASTAA
jgi:glycosyltransferase involved in cell wall biosynthesis